MQTKLTERKPNCKLVRLTTIVFQSSLQGIIGRRDLYIGSSLNNEYDISFLTIGREEIPIPLNGVDLQGADLRYANLQGADLEGAHLEGAILSHANMQGVYLKDVKLQGTYLEGTNFLGSYAGENYENFLERIGKPTQLSHVSPEKFARKDLQRITKIIMNQEKLNLNLQKTTEFRKFNYLNDLFGSKVIPRVKTKRIDLPKRIDLLKQAVGKTSLEWLNMQKRRYITGVLTWEEACKIRKKVSSPKALKRMGFDQVNWEEKCK